MKIEAKVFEELRNVVLEESGEDTIVRGSNERVLEHIGEKMALVYNTLRRKVNWVGYITNKLKYIKINFLLHDIIVGHMTDMKGVGRRRRRRRREKFSIRESPMTEQEIDPKNFCPVGNDVSTKAKILLRRTNN